MRSRWFGLVMAVLAAALSLLAWNRLPPEVASHWNVRGEPDDFMARTTAAVFGPLAILGLTLVMQVVPRIDPRRANYPRFLGTFWLIVNILVLFVFVIHAAVLANGAGAPVDPVRVIVIGLGVLVVVLGIVLPRLEPNWFLGIRTPWTLESATVWRTTHKVGGLLFVVAGIAALLLAWVPGVRALTVSVTLIAVAAAGSALLSLVLWLREKRGERTP